MALEDLKKKIYKLGAQFDQRLQRPEFFDPKKKAEEQSQEKWTPVKQKKPSRFRFQITPNQRKYLWRGGLILLAVVIVAAGFAFWSGLNSFDKGAVKLEILGPQKAVGGDEVTYIVKYRNETKVTLRAVRLTFEYPSGSVPTQGSDLVSKIDLGDLESGQEGQQAFLGALVGVKGDLKTAKTKLDYQPTNFNSPFSNEEEFETEIISIPLGLDFDLPAQLVSGQNFNFSLEYRNEADIAFEDLQIRIEYPEGFVFKSASPAANERDNLWNVGDLMADEQEKIFVEGTLQGEEGENKGFSAKLGLIRNGQFISYTQIAESTKIAVSPLSVTQSVNGVVEYIGKAGQFLDYEIEYKNTTAVPIKSVIITARLEGSALDFETLDLKQGSFDSFSQSIIWRASNLSELELLQPNQKGKVLFSINIKERLPISSYSDKNFVVVSAVEIDSLQPPLALNDIQIKGTSQLETKISSQLIVDAKGYYNDDIFDNSGPIPPQIGETTSYTIKWELSNTSNDLEGVQVSVYLPPHVQWKNQVSPPDADLEYSSNTGQLVWDVGDLSSATGLLVPTKLVAFQVSITPSLVHLGEFMELIGQSRASGQDSFTEIELSNLDLSLDTRLSDDSSIEDSGGRVVK